MFVRVLWGKLRHGMWDEYEAYYNSHVPGMTTGVPGFKGRQLMQSTENPDEGMSITLWDSLESLRAYDRNPKRQAAARGAEHLYTGEYWVRNFEIKSSTI